MIPNNRQHSWNTRGDSLSSYIFVNGVNSDRFGRHAWDWRQKGLSDQDKHFVVGSLDNFFYFTRRQASTWFILSYSLSQKTSLLVCFLFTFIFQERWIKDCHLFTNSWANWKDVTWAMNWLASLVSRASMISWTLICFN